MYCENFQDKSLSKGEFWSFTMVLDIVELSDKECRSNSILSVVTKGPGLFDLWSQHCFTLVRPAVTLRKVQYTWQEKSRKGKKGRTANSSEHKVSVYLAAGLQYFLQELSTALSMDIWDAHPASLWMVSGTALSIEARNGRKRSQWLTMASQLPFVLPSSHHLPSWKSHTAVANASDSRAFKWPTDHLRKAMQGD